MVQPLWKTAWQFPIHGTYIHYMIQQSHSWVFTLEKGKHYINPVHGSLQQHCSQLPQTGKNDNINKQIITYIITTWDKTLKNEQSHSWLVYLSGLSAGLQTKGSLVWFPVRAHAWVLGQVPSRGCTRESHTLMFLSLSPSLLFSLKINT